MRVNFVKSDGEIAHSVDMPCAPHTGDGVFVGVLHYSIERIRHMFEPTGRGGNYTYTVEALVEKVK